MSRINLGWGDGEFSVLLDLANCRLRIYYGDNVSALHEEFGGKNYYTSRSGRSGAGYVPKTPMLRPVNTIRTDVSRPWIPHVDWWEETIPGWYCFSPISYRGDNAIPHDIPFLALRKPKYFPAGTTDGMFLFHDATSFLQFVMNGANEDNLVHRTTVLNYIQWDAGENRPVKAEFHATAYCQHGLGEYTVRRFLTMWHADDMKFAHPLADDDRYLRGVDPRNNEFWSSIGMVYAGDYLVKIVKGVARDYISLSGVADFDRPDSLFTPAEIGQRFSVPGNVKMLSSRVLLKEQHGQFVAYGRFPVAESDSAFAESAYEVEVGLTDALRLLAEPPATDVLERITAELQEGAARKVALDNVRRNRENAPKLSDADWFTSMTELMQSETYSQIIIKPSDSMASGNCEVGTANFANTRFPGRESVELHELVPFLNEPSVVRVIEHVLVNHGAEVPVKDRFRARRRVTLPTE